MKEIVVVQGLFSKLSIGLNDSTLNKLAVIRKKDNPLAQIEAELKSTLQKFERIYFELNQPEASANNEVTESQDIHK